VPRRLRPDEQALWRHVTRRDTPLHSERARPVAPKPSFASAPVAAPSPPRFEPFRIGANVRTSAAPYAAAAPLRIDRRTQKELSRGKRSPEATIDLHGMTLAQAHPALTRFILASFATGRRLVLVITGKGRGDGADWHSAKGILRRHVPDWLSGPPLSGVVQEILPAHRSHGGAGAYYVLLRRD
jgi:DNA-nicking Smr family endonuclease